MRVKIKNYQAIRKADVEFDPGLTIIVGDTNACKSGLLRSIETAIFNKSGDSYVTQGESVTAVGILLNGSSVVWKKNLNKASKVAYKVNGKVLQKVGRGQPPEVAQALNISEISILNNKERLAFWKQMQYPFLLDKSPAQLYSFIALSSEEDNLTDVVKNMKVDLDRHKSKIKHIEGVIDGLKISYTKERSKFLKKKGYKTSYSSILSLDNKVRNLDILDNEVESTLVLHRKIRSGLLAKRKLDASLVCSKNVVISASELSRDLNDLDNLIMLIDKEEYDISYNEVMLDRVKKERGLLDIDNVSSMVESVKELNNSVQNFEYLISVINDIDKSISNTKSNLSSLNEEKVSKEELGSIDNKISSVLSLSNKVKSISKVVGELGLITDNINTDCRNISNLQIEKNKVKDGLGEFKVCPLCQRSLEEGCIHE